MLLSPELRGTSSSLVQTQARFVTAMKEATRSHESPSKKAPARKSASIAYATPTAVDCEVPKPSKQPVPGRFRSSSFRSHVFLFVSHHLLTSRFLVRHG
jgi:hypothetical protein